LAARGPIPPTHATTPIIDHWKSGLLEHMNGITAIDRKHIEMFHTLKILIGRHYQGNTMGTGWAVSTNRNAAVWDKGLQKFLEASAELEAVLDLLQH
jgi:hypothetical protein